MRRDDAPPEKTRRIWQIDFSRYGETIDHDPRKTIVPSPGSPNTAGRTALGVFSRFYADNITRLGAQIALGETIGTGGVGVVREAQQVALGRKVAVKTIRPEKRSDTTTLALLQEAWITGSIEHPSVVPVHDIIFDGEGNPLIVLKRIEGVAWSQLMGDRKRVRDLYDAEDLLDWNLGVLMQVLNAVRFAHSRGIVHRDLKPDNVMIGAFGEVYLVDWGLAVSLHDDESGRLPLARDVTALAGTPCYMAPEMLRDTDDPITERTDIYLTGAILYEILTGSPPHIGETSMQILSSVIKSSPQFPEGTPEGLARICRRAMDPDPDGRFENAEQMRLAIQGFLRHRGSTLLAHKASAALEELKSALGQSAPTDADHRQTIYRLYGACRFGFRESLTTWSSNEAAAAGLAEAARIMIEYELAQGDPRAAAALCADLAAPPLELRSRLDAAIKAAEAKRRREAKLQDLGHSLDLSVGQRTRLIAVLTLGLIFSLVPTFITLVWGDVAYRSHERLIAWNSIFVVLGIGLGYRIRPALRESAANMRLYILLMLLLAAQIPLELGLWSAGFAPAQSLVVHVFGWFFLIAVVAAMFDWRMAPAAVAYLATFFVMASLPAWRLYLVHLPHLALTINALIVWRPRPGRGQTVH